MNSEYWLKQAYKAATNSPDTSNQTGAVLVSVETQQKVGKSYNHFNKVKARLGDRDQKLARITHAEEGAVHSAWGAKGPLIMYAPWASCTGCARDIINCRAGIVELVVHQERMDMTPERWVQSIEYALEMLREAEIKVTYFRGRIPDSPPVIVNGLLWSPEKLCQLR